MENREKIVVIPANQNHKAFMIHANNQINQVNKTQGTNYLQENIDQDLFSSRPKFHCLVAQYEGIPVGMILYSYFYWANDGEVLWISQMFVEEAYRKKGIFFALIQKLKEENPDIHIVSCATGDENERMQKILKGYGGHEIDLKFYYIKK